MGTEIGKAVGEQASVEVLDASPEAKKLIDMMAKYFPEIDTSKLHIPISGKLGEEEDDGMGELGGKMFEAVGDSLTQVGGGGGVYSGATDIAASQLEIQRRMNDNLILINTHLQGASLHVSPR
jgi:hypothetical protein